MWCDFLDIVYLFVGDTIDDPGHYKYADKTCEDRPVAHTGTQFWGYDDVKR
jgi:hypothetical protein